MDDIRKNILQQREMQKVRLRNHFVKAFDAQASANGKDIDYAATQGAKEVKEEIETETCKGIEDDFGEPRIGDIEKGGDRIWNGEEWVSPEQFLFPDDIEKAKHQVGDRHPTKPWIWTEWAPGKFDWKSEKGKHHKGKSGSSTSTASQSSSTSKTTDWKSQATATTVKNLQSQVTQPKSDTTTKK